MSQPQSVSGNWSAPISATSGSGQTSYDTTTGKSGSGGFTRPIQRTYCFSGNVEIRLADGTLRAFESLSAEFGISNQTGTHLARLVVHKGYSGDMVEFAPGMFVTPNHLMKRGDAWIPAGEYFANATRVVAIDAVVYNLHIVSDRDEDHHYILSTGDVAHNFKANFDPGA